MEVLLLTLVLTGLAVAGLAAGVLMGRAPLKGSCGGVSCLKDVSCAGCPHRGPKEVEP